MCTIVVSVEPAARLPLLFLGVRDEVLSRPWAAPAAHWPHHPGLVGGLDNEAGGTWLAVAPTTRRIGCVLNGRGSSALGAGRRSRGELPLAAAKSEPLPDDLSQFSPFHLITAHPADGARLTSWNGAELSETRLATGINVIATTGRDPNRP